MRTPIRISHLTAERAYSQAMRAELRTSGEAAAIEREIPWPGLAEPHSQLAVPIGHGDELLGVLFVESGEDLRFGYDDEDALLGVASHLAVAMRQFQAGAEAADEPAGAQPAGQQASPAGEPLRVRYYDQDCSVFLGDDYLIKGVAGAVLWKLLCDHAQHGRTEFTNRELRLAPDIRLPEIGDNLEARLVLLTRRLIDRQACVRLEKTGRGRFRLCVARPLQLLNVPR